MLTDPADHAALVSTARARLTEAARPRRWFHLPSLPTTAAGKVDREALAEAVVAGGRGLRPLVPSTVVP